MPIEEPGHNEHSCVEKLCQQLSWAGDMRETRFQTTAGEKSFRKCLSDDAEKLSGSAFLATTDDVKLRMNYLNATPRYSFLSLKVQYKWKNTCTEIMCAEIHSTLEDNMCLRYPLRSK